MELKDKVEQVLTDGEYVTTSRKEADEIVKGAKEQGYDFTINPFEDYELIITHTA